MSRLQIGDDWRGVLLRTTRGGKGKQGRDCASAACAVDERWASARPTKKVCLCSCAADVGAIVEAQPRGVEHDQTIQSHADAVLVAWAVHVLHTIFCNMACIVDENARLAVRKRKQKEAVEVACEKISKDLSVSTSTPIHSTKRFS